MRIERRTTTHLCEVPNPTIKDVADQYADARRSLRMTCASGVLMPRINVSAVAIELYLKSLSNKTSRSAAGNMMAITNTKSVGTHKLSKIVGSIVPAVRDLLERRFEQTSKRENRSFSGQLAALKGAFQRSRYPYENSWSASGISLNGLEDLVEFLSNFVCELLTQFTKEEALI